VSVGVLHSPPAGSRFPNGRACHAFFSAAGNIAGSCLSGREKLVLSRLRGARIRSWITWVKDFPWVRERARPRRVKDMFE